jgi:hypothetical protein
VTAPDRDGALYAVSGSPPRLLLESRAEDAVLGVVGRRYWVLDEDAAVLAEYGPEFSCDCEIGYRTVYERRDGTLLRYFGRSDDTSDRFVTWEATKVLDLSRPVPPDDPRAIRVRR